MLRLATKKDIDHIVQIAASLKKELGYVRTITLREAQKNKWLFYHSDGAFCNFRLRKDGITVIYEIGVIKESRKKGIGKQMIEKLPKPIKLKCPIDNESNEFYKHLKFELIGIEKGKKRKLNVWLLDNVVKNYWNIDK